MSDHDPGQVNTLGFEDILLFEPPSHLGVGVGGDRHAGFTMCLCTRPQGSFDVGSDPRFIGRALDDGGLDAGVGNTVDDVANEVGGHRVDCARLGNPSQVIMGEFVEGIQPGCDHDVQVDLGCDPRYARDVAAKPDRGGIQNGVDPGLLEFVEPGDGVRNTNLLIAPLVWVVLLNLGGDHEDMFVHQNSAKVRGFDRPGRGFDCGC